MVLHNPNNWHWVNKDVSSWTNDYLSKDLVGLKADGDDGTHVEVSKLLSMDGDVDVSQRKGKVITIFDVRLQLEWTGTLPGEKEDDVSGTITIPEVAHDTDEDEYVFEVEIYSSASSKEPAKDLVRKALTPQIRKRLQMLAPALISEHGKDLQHPPGTDPSANFAKSTVLQSSSVAKSGNRPAGKTETTSSDNVNVTKFSDTQEFRTTAEQLFQTFTDPQRIAAFTRTPPTVFEGAKEGAKFEIFGGNVSGSFVTLDKPTRIDQKWRLAQWPSGHYSLLKLKFEQNDVDGVTVMRVDWEGVPVGEEETTKRNWNDYYVRSIKTTFGFGTVL
ncbi:hypothetical protein K470DRAFT_259131 [Piedraia hortae CBS 480.64]|uniref:Activator of Hsp90 ATPase AHSA1-like N-terminal domain-containing protein n=1 Tax=Piedraia hortae CBS 480.64 TaxID=1314780 RepID=A0A6A7BVI8_9PEZI|nr:hypothetical protein K470DRAFT_259131 [Piedraia hortae CBS 480.64]